jgi:hypothetical protein
VDPTDVELIPLRRFGRRIPLGIAVILLFVVVAVAKPWPNAGSPAPAASTSPPAEAVAGATAGAVSVSPADQSLCANSDGWQVVTKDVELARNVQTWLVASVVYSTVRPEPSTLPVTSVVSTGLSSLGFCVPAEVSGPGKTNWSATLWLAGDAAHPAAWQPAALLTPLPGALGALAHPRDRSAAFWPPGLYVLEAHFDGSNSDAWLGLMISNHHP